MSKEENAVGSERREHERYSVDIQVQITADFGKTAGKMIGTSLEGLMIKTTSRMQPATDVVITFSTGEKVIMLAGVVWVLDESQRGLPLYSTGLKINSVSVNDEELKGMAERTAFMQDLLE